MCIRNARKIIMTFSVLLSVLLISGTRICQAGEWIIPVKNSQVFFQTNGPLTEFDNGDWWTNINNGIGSQAHVYELIVPPVVDSTFSIVLEIYDPESFASDNDLDEQNGMTWDKTTFTLWNPAGNKIVARRVFERQFGGALPDLSALLIDH